MKKTLLVWILALSLVIVGCSKKTTSTEWSELISFAECITQAGATFYGTERCSHCQNQKALFGASIEKVNFIDCDKQSALCQAAWVTWYPTWKFADGSVLQWTQPLETLAQKTNCSLTPATDAWV